MTAFLTLQKSANVSQPGDTVYVMAGTYNLPCSGCDLVRILSSGTASAPITYSALAGTRPILNSSGGWQAIHIDASTIIINGFEVEGDARSVPSSQRGTETAPSAGNGILVEPIPCAYNDGNPDCRTATAATCPASSSARSQVPPCFIHGGTTPRNIVINNTLVHDEPGSGIKVDYSDYIKVTNNTVHDNANWSPDGQSGISLWELTDTEGDVLQELRDEQRRYWNQQLVNTASQGYITDGNGIIIDDNQKTQSSGIAYNGRTLVANNVLDHNGGSGAHAYSSQHVDFVANTTHLNQQTVGKRYGELFSLGGDDVNFYNNIMGHRLATIT